MDKVIVQLMQVQENMYILFNDKDELGNIVETENKVVSLVLFDDGDVNLMTVDSDGWMDYFNPGEGKIIFK